MRRFLVFQKMHPGNRGREGEICVAVDGIVAMESCRGTGDGMTTLTLGGGREIHIEGGLQQTKQRVADPRKSKWTREPSAADRMFGDGFLRDFFGMRRA